MVNQLALFINHRYSFKYGSKCIVPTNSDPIVEIISLQQIVGIGLPGHNGVIFILYIKSFGTRPNQQGAIASLQHRFYLGIGKDFGAWNKLQRIVYNLIQTSFYALNKKSVAGINQKQYRARQLHSFDAIAIINKDISEALKIDFVAKRNYSPDFFIPESFPYSKLFQRMIVPLPESCLSPIAKSFERTRVNPLPGHSHRS